MDTTIRKLDPKLYRELKAVAALQNVTVGTAVNEAIGLWIAKKNNGRKHL
jgi:hypothetical protein